MSQTVPSESPVFAVHRVGVATPDLDGAVASEGQVQCIAVADLIDGEKVTIHDGEGPVDFVFNVSGAYVPPGGYDNDTIEIDVSAATDEQDVALLLQSAIDAHAFTVATDGAPVGGLLELINETPGSAGNVAITDTVANVGFTHTGMAGGADGTAALVDDRHAMSLTGYETAIIQVIPAGNANPSIEILFWSDAASRFISEPIGPMLPTPLTWTGQGANVAYQVKAPVCGGRMFVKVTAIAAGTVDIYIAAFGRR